MPAACLARARAYRRRRRLNDPPAPLLTPSLPTNQTNNPQAGLLMFNGVAILNNERFLEKCAWLWFLSGVCVRGRLGASSTREYSARQSDARPQLTHTPETNPPHLTPHLTPPPHPPTHTNQTKPKTDGWGFSQMHQSSYSLKASVIGSIHAAHYFRAFLMVINAIVIVVKLLSG